MAGPKRTGVYVTGLRERVKSFQNLGASLDEMKDTFAAISADAAEHMRKYIPRGKGEHSGALLGTVRGNRAKARAAVQIGRARVPYAPVQNYGWRKHNIHGQNFVARFDAAYADRALQLVADGLNDLAEKYGATDE